LPVTFRFGPRLVGGESRSTPGGTENYPPAAQEIFVPPIPVPDKVRGFHLEAAFDVDETGDVLSYTFTPTPDPSYDKQLDKVLGRMRFLPGARPDGTPVRMKARIVYDF